MLPLLNDKLGIRWLSIAALCVLAFALAAGCAAREAKSADVKTSVQESKMEENPKAGAQKQAASPAPEGKEIATLANGCFWCTEAIFKDLRGVEKVEPGYTGGRRPNPTYEQVCTGTTGHAEAIQITFDPKEISFHDLLAIFFSTHDPTTLNRQGADVGTQYRSAIFYHDPEQKAVAEQMIAKLNKEKLWRNPIVTEVTEFSKWYAAEDYHKDYFARNSGQSYCQMVIAPKVAKFRKEYREKLKR